MAHTPSPAGRLARAASLIGLCILVFVFGAFTTEFQTFPYPQLLERPFRAYQAYLERWNASPSPASSPNWSVADSEETGLVDREADRAYTGYTVYTSMHEPRAHMLNSRGDVVHTWHLPFSEVWTDPPHIERPVSDDNVVFSALHTYRDGGLLVSYHATGDTPYGYGLAKMNRESEIEWRYAAHTHHDFHVGDDGRVWALVHRLRRPGEDPVPGMSFEVSPVLDDHLVRLSADGEVLESHSLLDAIGTSPHAHILRTWRWSPLDEWDRLHTNAVDAVSADFAEHHPFADPGDLLVSFRTLHAVALIAPETMSVAWVTRGPWLAQHDPDALPDGDVMIFDNLGHPGPGGASRILEITPPNGGINWSYGGRREAPFDSSERGKQQRLPNGNTLITESVGGRIFEITPDGEIVWDFRNPVRRRDKGQSWVPHVAGSVERLTAENLSFRPSPGKED